MDQAFTIGFPAVAGSNTSGASARDDRDRGRRLRETCGERRRVLEGCDTSSGGIYEALQGYRKEYPNVSSPSQFVPDHGEGSWGESSRIVDARGGGCSDAIVVVSGFHARKVWPNVSSPSQFVPEHGEGSWGESAWIVDTRGGGYSDAIVEVLGFHA